MRVRAAPPSLGDVGAERLVFGLRKDHLHRAENGGSDRRFAGVRGGSERDDQQPAAARVVGERRVPAAVGLGPRHGQHEVHRSAAANRILQELDQSLPVAFCVDRVEYAELDFRHHALLGAADVDRVRLSLSRWRTGERLPVGRLAWGE